MSTLANIAEKLPTGIPVRVTISSRHLDPRSDDFENLFEVSHSISFEDVRFRLKNWGYTAFDALRSSQELYNFLNRKPHGPLIYQDSTVSLSHQSEYQLSQSFVRGVKRLLISPLRDLTTHERELASVLSLFNFAILPSGSFQDSDDSRHLVDVMVDLTGRYASIRTYQPIGDPARNSWRDLDFESECEGAVVKECKKLQRPIELGMLYNAVASVLPSVASGIEGCIERFSIAVRPGVVTGFDENPDDLPPPYEGAELVQGRTFLLLPG